jgi:hypothetical protein
VRFCYPVERLSLLNSGPHASQRGYGKWTPGPFIFVFDCILGELELVRNESGLRAVQTLPLDQRRHLLDRLSVQMVERETPSHIVHWPRVEAIAREMLAKPKGEPPLRLDRYARSI